MCPYIIVGSLLVVFGKDFLTMFYDISHLWYLLFLFECFCLVMLFRFTKYWAYPKISFALLVVWVIISMKYYLPIRPLGLNFLFKYLPYFFIGTLLAYSKVREGFRHFNIYILLLSFIVAVISLTTFYYDWTHFSNKYFMDIYCVVAPFIPISFFI